MHVVERILARLEQAVASDSWPHRGHENACAPREEVLVGCDPSSGARDRTVGATSREPKRRKAKRGVALKENGDAFVTDRGTVGTKSTRGRQADSWLHRGHDCGGCPEGSGNTHPVMIMNVPKTRGAHSRIDGARCVRHARATLRRSQRMTVRVSGSALGSVLAIAGDVIAAQATACEHASATAARGRRRAGCGTSGAWLPGAHRTYRHRNPCRTPAHQAGFPQGGVRARREPGHRRLCGVRATAAGVRNRRTMRIRAVSSRVAWRSPVARSITVVARSCREAPRRK